MKIRLTVLIVIIIISISAWCSYSCYTRKLKLQWSNHWPAEVTRIHYVSTADGTEQPAMFFAPQHANRAPLLVSLHTWSESYAGRLSVPYAEWCLKKGWVFINPDCRGPHNRPEAAGSSFVIQDILSAVDYCRRQANVDDNRIYLVGLSGGGYTGLLAAGKIPDVWAGVSVWAPITDIAKWYYECLNKYDHYCRDLRNVCGGAPGESEEVEWQYRDRSPLTHLHPSLDVAVDINAGITDGHTHSVPISHSLFAFNKLVRREDRFTDEEIAYFVDNAEVPPHLSANIEDVSYGVKNPLFRRVSGRVRITVFNGGHEIVYEAALKWLEMQERPETHVERTE